MLTTEQVLAENREGKSNVRNLLSAVPYKENKFRHPLKSVKKETSIFTKPSKYTIRTKLGNGDYFRVKGQLLGANFAGRSMIFQKRKRLKFPSEIYEHILGSFVAQR